MKEQEIYVIGLIHNIGLLKKEMSANFPNWRFNYGIHGFLTYRNEAAYTPKELRDQNITFALVKGISLYRGSRAELEQNISKHHETYSPHTTHEWDLVEEKGVMGDRKERGLVFDIIRVAEDDFILGLRLQVRGDFAPYSGSSPIPFSDGAPSKAYQKLGEAFKHFRPHVGHEEVFLDIGCSPGGSTFYLMEKGFRVIGVDPTPISPVIKEHFPEGFLQLSQSFFELKKKHLLGLPPVNWIVLDVELPILETLPKLLKLVSKMDFVIGLFLTVKMNLEMEVEKMELVDELLEDAEFREIRKGQLPSHDREYCIVAKKVD